MVFKYDYFNPDEIEDSLTTKTNEQIYKENKEWLEKLIIKKPKNIKN